MTRIFKLFTNIIPVRGAKRSTLCDLQRGRIKLIPNSLYDILADYRDQPLTDILAAHDEENHAVIEEYFRFLLEDEWGFLCADPERFPAISLEYDAPHHIANAIIDVDQHSHHNYVDLCRRLEDLGCRGLQIRVYSPMDFTWLEQVLADFASSRLRNVDLWMPDHPSLDDETVIGLLRRHPRVYRLVLHGSALADVTATGPSKTMGLLVRIPEVIDGEHHCGHVDRSYFISELYTFAEASQWNSCLNRKIAIDKRGFLRNCPSMNAHFGRADTKAWREVIDSPEFRAVWSISKDQIEVCKDCEFRYVCTDCRAYAQDDRMYGKPAKCHYDPYTAQWQDHHTPAVMPV